MKRSKSTIAIAWIAFLGPFGYGFLESSLNAMYPVYALRNGMELTSVSMILAIFSIGGITSQLPLGMLSDKMGRHVILPITYGGGAIAFWAASLMGNSVPLIMLTVFIAGLFVGSVFSLGISFMSDLTPKNLLPTGNLLCGIFFSIGSLTGPFAGGLFLEFIENVSYLLIISILFGVLFIISLYGLKKRKSILV